MTPNKTLQKLIKNKAAKNNEHCYRIYQITMQWSVISNIQSNWVQSWLFTVIDQYVHRSIQNKVTMHQTQSVVTTATGHAGQRMAGCSRWQNKNRQGQPTQAINRHSNPNTGQPINLQQCERKGGSGLYRSLGNHCHSDGVLANYDWTEGSWVR